MEINLVSEGLKFMVLGMIVVFVFLAVLVELMKLQAKLIAKYFPEKEPEAKMQAPRVPATDEASRTAAIIAAIAEFKKNKS
ncbi:MAG: Na+-transporting oxaloacetate decarboxylase subunit gamma [Campylobacteraceae bacterium 4484_4]|nr:MAG: Na+-transporting oxaloacetate decarboxylase subunit gamma [Campylobacteraceae bacterium 4484_4]